MPTERRLHPQPSVAHLEGGEHLECTQDEDTADAVLPADLEQIRELVWPDDLDLLVTMPHEC